MNRSVSDLDNNVNGDRLWTVEDVMEFLGVSKSWVYHKAASCEIPSIRIGKMLRFRKKDILKWLADQQTVGAA